MTSRRYPRPIPEPAYWIMGVAAVLVWSFIVAVVVADIAHTSDSWVAAKSELWGTR